MQPWERINLHTIALERGATTVKTIDPQDIVVAEWVRHKCRYGCPLYGKRFTCPPYTPGPEETGAMLRSYHNALLIEFAGLTGNALEHFKTTTETAMILEKTAFVNGYEKAMAFGAGTCSLCGDCPAAKLTEPSAFSKKDCLHPMEARPSMEAVGIDVYSTVRNCGFKLATVKQYTDPFTLFGLVLIE